MKQRFYQFWINRVIFLFYLIVSSPAQAQIEVIPDTTLPNNSKVESTGSVTTISEGTQVGKNLFHSFSQFSVNNGITVNFNNFSDIQNIISRVTGSSISNIDGTINAGGANLFLINPNGILFGPNASLNIGGSFIASTASSINFADGTSFSATSQTTPLLSVSVPIGLQFGEKAGEIRNQSRARNSSRRPVGLQVMPGKTLALIGGNVSLDSGRLTAPDGRVELGGLASSGTVGLNFEDDNLRLTYPAGVQRADVSIFNNAFVNVASRGEGSITINARNLDISGSTFNAGIGTGLESINSRVGDITLDATENITIAKSNILNQMNPEALGGKSGNILINSGALSLTESTVSTNTYNRGGASGNVVINVRDQVNFANQSKIFAQTNGLGNSGDISIKTGSLSLTGSSELNASTFGPGNAGKITVQADNSVDLDHSSISTVAEPTLTNPIVGNAGEINIRSESLTLKDGAALFTRTTGEGGRAGNVIIDTQDNINLANSAIYSDTSGKSNAGDTRINTRSLSLTDSGRISSSTTGEGNAGKIEINASDLVSISGVNPKGLSSETGIIYTGRLSTTSSGVFTTTRGTSTNSQSGNITVNTDALRVSDGGVLSGETGSASPGGNITVNVNTLDLTNGGQILTSAWSSGRAGNITVNASDRVTISGSDRTYASRFAESPETVDNDGAASGLLARVRGNEKTNAGEIKVTAPAIRLDNQGTITTETTLGEGGDINLKATGILLRHNSSVSATAGTANASGNGGNIIIDTDWLAALENSDITAEAFNGNGGNIRILTQGLFLSPDSKISASSKKGIDGIVEINRPESEPRIGLVALPTDLVDVTGLIAQGCGAGGGNVARSSKFIATGRGGLPPNPTEALRSGSALADLGTTIQDKGDRPTATTDPIHSESTPLVEAQGWVLGSDGKVILTAQVPAVTSRIPWLTPNTCNG